MTAYFPIVLGQDALQWLRHLPQHCIDDWSDFSWRFTANFESLSDKPAQPWDLNSIKREGDETLRSYLKRFQTMRNRIPEVAEVAVIEDFYWGSNDSAFIQAILQKALTTSEQLFREVDLYITADERPQDLIGGAKPTPAAPRCDANQQPDKRWEKRPREEVHAAGPPTSRARGGPRGGEHTLDDILDAQCPYHKDMRHTLRNCRDFKHSMGTADPSNLCHLPHHEEDLENLDNLNSRRGRRRGVPTHRRRSQCHLRRTWVARKQEAAEAQRPSDTGGDHWSSRPVSMVRTPDHLHSGGSVAQLRPPGQILAFPRTGEAASMSPSPGHCKAWEFPSKSSTSQTLISSASCRLKENIHWDTSTCRSPSELWKTIEPSS
jgi:hypothetical protein